MLRQEKLKSQTMFVLSLIRYLPLKFMTQIGSGIWVGKLIQGMSKDKYCPADKEQVYIYIYKYIQICVCGDGTK